MDRLCARPFNRNTESEKNCDILKRAVVARQQTRTPRTTPSLFPTRPLRKVLKGASLSALYSSGKANDVCSKLWALPAQPKKKRRAKVPSRGQSVTAEATTRQTV